MSYSHPVKAPFNDDDPIGEIYDKYDHSCVLNSFRKGARLLLANESAAQSQYLVTQTRLSRAQSDSDLELVAKGAGRVYAWSLANSNLETLQNALTLLCSALVAQDGKIHYLSCDAAAAASQASADWFIVRGAKRHAATQLTAKATAIGAKRELSQDDIETARDAVRLSFQYKSKDSLDWHYSVFAAATIDQRSTTNAKTLSKSRKQLARSFSRLADDVSSDERMVALTLLARIESRIFDVLVEDQDCELFDRHKRSLTIPSDFENFDLRELLRSNPAVVGQQETPNWLPQTPETSQVRLARRTHVQDICHRLHSALDDAANVTPATKLDARAALAQLEWKSEPTKETYLTAVRALGASANAAYPMEYLTDVIDLFTRARPVLNEAPPLDLLRNISRCYDRIRADEPAEAHLERVGRLAHQLRFAACELARHELWSESAHLINATRRVLDYGSTVQFPHNGCRMHVTHDPFSSFVIIERRDGTVEGRQCSVDGRLLARLWYSFSEDDPGVAVLEDMRRDRTRFRVALQAALGALKPIIDKVLELAGGVERVALEPGGIYYRAPLASLIEAAAPGRFKCISISFRQHHALQPSIDSSAAISASASDGPGGLRNSDPEARNVAAITRGKAALGATSDQILALLKAHRVVHFAGHSQANLQASLLNTILTSSGDISAGQLTELAPYACSLVFLNSCQSSLNSGSALVDEHLTLDGVLVRCGVEVVVGCLTRVLDVAAGLVAARFYLNLEGHPQNPDADYRALADAQLWARRAPLVEIVEFNAGLPTPFDMPNSLAFGDPDGRPLSHPQCWVGYQLSVAAKSE